MFASGKAAAVASAANYIEDVFSTYLYTGNGSTQTITNGIDLSTYGGMVWVKGRDTSAQSATSPNRVFDTLRGFNVRLETNSTAAQAGTLGVLSSFNSNGFSLDTNRYEVNGSGSTYASWTFRKQPKFFDVVTYTGDGASARAISHNLGSTPGCIIVKSTSSVQPWAVYHRSNGNTKVQFLNTTAAATVDSNMWANTDPTSTTFTVDISNNVNLNGATYVAYLFAHNAGGFGLTGTDNVISCGSFTSDGSGLATVNLGYEAQWVLIKNTTSAEDWQMYDVMRGMSYSSAYWLRPNLSNAEGNVGSNTVFPTATGFTFNGFAASQTGIYIAIRRGPMKVPTSGTSVFTPIARTGTGANATVSGVGFPPDLFIGQIRGTAGYWNGAVDRLRGVTKRLVTSQTNAEDTTTDAVTSFTMDGSTLGIDSNGFVNESGKTYIEWNFQRAPSFFDEVCYTGTGSATTVTHNLGVVPELIICKSRSAAGSWPVYSAALGNTKVLFLRTIDAEATNSTFWNNTSPTASVFTIATNTAVNTSGTTYVAYLFASCPGVSKVGSYTGTATTLQIDCGFTGGARFVLIKRTDSTGDWYVWDSARGIVAGNDPYLLLNSTAAEVTNTDYVDTYSAGFEISSTAPAAINANGGTFIFLAIA
jgi:hypothetical protein